MLQMLKNAAIYNIQVMLVKAHLSAKCEVPKLQCFSPLKRGTFKKVRFFVLFQKAWSVLFYIFKKINQNQIVAIGS